MKRFILLPMLLSCFFAGNSIAQRTVSNGAAMPASYSGASATTGLASYNTAAAAPSNYTSRSEPVSRPAPNNQLASAYVPDNSGNTRLPGSTLNNNSAGVVSSYSPGNTRSVGNNHGTLITINGATRYNYATKRSYPYYPSTHKRHSDKRVVNGTHLLMREHVRRPESGYTPYFYTCYYVFDDVPDNSGSLVSGNNALNTSLDGYVVYGTDTLDGIVTLTNSNVFLEQQADAKREYSYLISYNDKSLKTVVVYNGDNTLFLSRASIDDNLLSRVLHGGKLTIYDDAYSFPTANNLDPAHMKVRYNDHVKHIANLDPKRALIKEINKAYNLDLKAGNFTWQTLIAYINKLQ